MDPAQADELLDRVANQLFRAGLAINSAEQVVQNAATPRARHVRRKLREATDCLDAALRDIRAASLMRVAGQPADEHGHTRHTPHPRC